MTATRAGSGTASRTASRRFRRTPASGTLQTWRRQWGQRWGAINRELAKGLRAKGE